MTYPGSVSPSGEGTGTTHTVHPGVQTTIRMGPPPPYPVYTSTGKYITVAVEGFEKGITEPGKSVSLRPYFLLIGLRNFSLKILVRRAK